MKHLKTFLALALVGVLPFAAIAVAATITGTEQADNIIGTTDNDTLAGLGGDDIIFGQSGADTIDGGSGDDRIRGDGVCPRGQGTITAYCASGGRGPDRI